MKALLLSGLSLFLMMPFMATNQVPDPYELAQLGVNRNTDWIPYHENINGTEMVLVPVGCFMMGSTQESIDALISETDWADFRNELPQNEQCFDQPFWIGRYEVSNAEYARFIEVGGYDNADYWTEDGWKWRMETDRTQPRFWIETEWNAPQQPVVGVAWYEAMAYAAWLDMSLPTEAEWEYAARGMENWLYPWGNEFDGRKLNFCDMSCGLHWKDTHDDDGYGLPAPIRTYEDGVSWVGAFDMSGNIAEWILSIYDPIQYPYPYIADDGRNALTDDWRILRGGSWYSSPILVRSAARGYTAPENDDVEMGFRVVLHPQAE